MRYDNDAKQMKFEVLLRVAQLAYAGDLEEKSWAWFFFVVCTRCSAALKRLFASGISANSSHTCT